LLASCKPTDETADGARILTVIVPDARVGALASFEHDLVDLFASRIHARVKLRELPAKQARSAVLAHRAQFAAGLDRAGTAGLQLGPTYRTARLQVLCGASTPKDLEQLAKLPLAVVAGSVEELALKKAQASQPSLSWESRTGVLQPKLLDDVIRGDLGCTLASEHLVSKLRNLHPGLEPSFDMDDPVEFVWAFPPDADKTLQQQAETFFAEIKADGTLRNLLDRHFRPQEKYLTPQEAANFILKIETELPRYRKLFEDAERVSGIGWQLVAAVAFHESNWDPSATSPTNVRGMMMLTEDTAERMNVNDRLNARQSTLGGVRYLKLIKSRLPPSIEEPDRTWFALAAYNQGMAHLEDARVLAQRRGLNPNYWADVKRVLPLLADPAIHSSLKFGSARGGEAVFMVEKIRQYSEILMDLSAETAAEVD